MGQKTGMLKRLKKVIVKAMMTATIALRLCMVGVRQAVRQVVSLVVNQALLTVSHVPELKLAYFALHWFKLIACSLGRQDRVIRLCVNLLKATQ